LFTPFVYLEIGVKSEIRSRAGLLISLLGAESMNTLYKTPNQQLQSRIILTTFMKEYLFFHRLTRMMMTRSTISFALQTFTIFHESSTIIEEVTLGSISTSHLLRRSE
jgi:hypothetical protein